MSESRNVSYISMENEFNKKIEKESKINPIDERAYSEELFKMGREQALLDSEKIMENQTKYYNTRYKGDIKNSVHYLRGYKRGIELAKSDILPPEYIEIKDSKHK